MDTIVLKNVSKKFAKKEVLKGIDLTINKGDIVGYLGPNGSGKTTTINLITGLRKCSRGSIYVLDNDVNKNYDRLFGKVGVLYDENGLYDRLTAKENIEYFLNLFSINKEDNEAFLNDIFKESDFNSISNIEVRKMSKGMKRMLALIRALIIKPEILILDEPFDGLDIENRMRFIKIIRKYYSEYKPTIILTSHIMADIEMLATKIVIIKSGQILYNNSIDHFHKFSQSIDYKKLEREQSGNIMTDAYLEILNQDYKEEIN